jgi:hypothetical protein
MQNLRRLTVAILCALLVILQDARGDVVRIATWNLEWFPGGKPNSSQAERLIHMSAARDTLIDIRPDILCLQEVRDWDSVAELVSILPDFQTLVVSRFREMGSSGPLSIQQLAIASTRPAEAAWSEPFKPSPATPPRGFSFAAIRRGKTLLLVYSVHVWEPGPESGGQGGGRGGAGVQKAAVIGQRFRRKVVPIQTELEQWPQGGGPRPKHGPPPES